MLVHNANVHTTVCEFEEELKGVSLKFEKNESDYKVSIAEEKYEIFQTLIKKYGMQYSIRDTDNYNGKQNRILWSSALVSYCGNPFVIQKVQSFHCSNGPKYFNRKSAVRDLNNSNSNETNLPSENIDHAVPVEKTKKLSRKALKANAAVTLHGHPTRKCTRFRHQPSKKIGCEATMKTVITKNYPEYKITGKRNLDDEKREIMKRLKTELQSDANSILVETIYHVSFSLTTKHSHPIWISFRNQELHFKLKEEIKNLVNSGITNTETIQTLLNEWVRENVGDNVCSSSRAFYPTKKIIRNYVLKYVDLSRQSKVDQVALQPKKNSWEEEFSENEYITIVIPSPESVSSPENIIPVSKFRELIKHLYDRSFLLKGDSVDSSLERKVIELSNIMDQYIETDEELNTPILPVSDLARTEKRKKCD